MQVSNSDLDQWTADAALHMPEITGVNRIALLRALCSQESSYGKLANPRHEISWCPLSRTVSHVAKSRHEVWGCLSCMSYGVLQGLYHSIADAYIESNPARLIDQRVAFNSAIALLIHKIKAQNLTTVSSIADAWNSGSAHDVIVPSSYITSVNVYYSQELNRV